jgi:hypothetical protein
MKDYLVRDKKGVERMETRMTRILRIYADFFEFRLLKKYRQIIVQLLQKYADMPSISDPNTELEALQPKKINSF